MFVVKFPEIAQFAYFVLQGYVTRRIAFDAGTHVYTRKM